MALSIDYQNGLTIGLSLPQTLPSSALTEETPPDTGGFTLPEILTAEQLAQRQVLVFADAYPYRDLETETDIVYQLQYYYTNGTNIMTSFDSNFLANIDYRVEGHPIYFNFIKEVKVDKATGNLISYGDVAGARIITTTTSKYFNLVKYNNNQRRYSLVAAKTSVTINGVDYQLIDKVTGESPELLQLLNFTVLPQVAPPQTPQININFHTDDFKRGFLQGLMLVQTVQQPETPTT